MHVQINTILNKSTGAFLLGLMLAAFFAGCVSTAPRQSVATTGPAAEEQSVEPVLTQQPEISQAYVDAYTVGGDDWTPVYNPEIRRAGESLQQWIPQATVPESVPVADTVQTIARQAQGFRVQLANVTSEASAMAFKEEATAIFDSVYVIFQRPNYKVRVGDFLTRSTADAAADSARRFGFRDAWVVPSRVWVITRVGE